MPLIELIRSYLEYNDAMSRRVWESIEQITDEQFVTTLDYSHGSIRDLMLHMAVVDSRWLRGLKEEPDARSFSKDPVDFPTRMAAFEFWSSSANQLLDFVHSLDEAQLSSTPLGMFGPAWQVLLHLVNHGTDHRAQVLRALHNFGAPTFDQDYILYQWFR